MAFNTQICTTVEQSKRLIELGLRKETADMCWIMEGFHYKLNPDPYVFGSSVVYAWSLHRLLSMCLEGTIDVDGREVTDYLSEETMCRHYNAHENLYDNLIDCISLLIHKNYFNKLYLDIK